MYEYILGGSYPFDGVVETAVGRHSVLTITRAASSISLYSNICVVVSYFFILWYQSSMVNRISLRLIVFACLCNIIYNVMILTLTAIEDTDQGCSVLIYFVVATDIMSCMCLAMIGVNLVVILIVRVNRPAKMEKYYYAFIIFVTLVGMLVPLSLPVPTGVTSGRKCWYFYYFLGRATRFYKWMWYYGCLLFSILLATICSVLIIAKFARRQDIFAGTLDMASRGDAIGDIETSVPHHRRPIRVGQKTTVIFRKVILRCICYPLIPLICKGCGVGIEAAAISNSFIPIGVVAADALLGNLIGFFISCIYFTDPAVIAVVGEICKRLKCRYVDEYCSAEALLKVPPHPPPSPTSFPPISAPALDQNSNRVSRRLFSADDASTISKHSSRSELSILTISAPSSNNSEEQFNLNLLHGHQIAQDLVQGRTSVALGILGNTAAKSRKPANNSPREEIVRSATGRRYTYPHVDIQDPHGRIADLVNRIHHTARLSPSTGSPVASSNIEEQYSYPWFRRAYHIFFPCLVPQDEKDEFLYMMPMHIVGGNRSIRRAGMDTVSMNEIWALDEIQQRRQSVRNRSSMGDRSSRSTFNGMRDGRNKQPMQIIEYYKHPRLAMFIHWLLIHVFRVMPTKKDTEQSVELVNVTTNQTAPLTEPVRRTTPIVGHSNGLLQQQQLQHTPKKSIKKPSLLSDEQSIVTNKEKVGSETAVEFEGEEMFFKRSSIRAVSFISSPSGSLEKSKNGFFARSFSSMSSHNEDRLRLPSDSEGDPKGKRPIMKRLRSFEREPPFTSLRPGKDTGSRKSSKSLISSSPVSAEKFVVTITDTGGDAEHHEIYPIHPAEGSSKHQSSGSKEHRPRIFRHVSDVALHPSAKDKSLLQHVWGRGTSPSKSMKIAKQFAEKVGDTSIVKSMGHRQSDESSLSTSDDLSEGLSPPQSVQFSPASRDSNETELFAQALDARPRAASKRERREFSLEAIMSTTRQLEPSIAKQLMLDDFGMEHFVEPSGRRRPTEKERQVIDRALEVIHGFSAGASRIIYIGNWEQAGECRVVQREEPWDLDGLLL